MISQKKGKSIQKITEKSKIIGKLVLNDEQHTSFWNDLTYLHNTHTRTHKYINT